MQLAWFLRVPLTMCARQAAPFSPPNLSHPLALLSRQQCAPVSPLAATLMDLHASVANKRGSVDILYERRDASGDRGCRPGRATGLGGPGWPGCVRVRARRVCV